MTSYRSRWQIIKEILNIIQQEKNVTKTRIMHKAYIDWKNFNKHFEFLIKENLIYRTEENKYILTNEGKVLLKKLEDINGVLNKVS